MTTLPTWHLHKVKVLGGWKWMCLNCMTKEQPKHLPRTQHTTGRCEECKKGPSKKRGGTE